MTSTQWQARLKQVAIDYGVGDLNPILLPLCATALAQWEQVTEEVTTRPELVDSYFTKDGQLAQRDVPPEFKMQVALIGQIRSLLKDLGLIDLSKDPLRAIRKRLGVGAN
jgi:hypothetical protein